MVQLNSKVIQQIMMCGETRIFMINFIGTFGGEILNLSHIEDFALVDVSSSKILSLKRKGD